MIDPHHILVVEDDPVARATLASYFEAAKYRVTEAEDGEAMWKRLANTPVDLILLDINLPGEDGFSLLRELRRTSDVAVIMVTGKTDALDRILGLELGAHDYVTKPFNARELMARAKNLIRLTRAARIAVAQDSALYFDGWMLDKTARRLTSPEGRDVTLTRGEFDLLAILVNCAGRAMTRDSLLDHVSHRDGDPYDRTIDVLIGRLRRKIEADPKEPRRLITVHGVGYMFVPPASDAKQRTQASVDPGAAFVNR
ncbi:response regulator [Hoeflea prorocentri]|uniref:Regulatory protein VirG n=1 Tax=Hoeflea prorocentri TaxID=1922333 RepID=A0A9X3ULK1_9HYPH|nr:response regulator [Hoeflea prorocentri]MCY6382796.1 response regulator [Hoeflea prorocentri]MDA5400596.1 response regulator [Hoeflea prorocentri]